MFSSPDEAHNLNEENFGALSTLITPIPDPELIARYRNEASFILKDEALQNVPGLINTIKSVRNSFSSTPGLSAISVADGSFSAFFSSALLRGTQYRVVDTCPSIPFTQLGIAQQSMPEGRRISGICLGDTYIISTEANSDDGIHFHELVHVVQSKFLDSETSLLAYAAELVLHGYRDNFFEKMAYRMHREYIAGYEPYDVAKRVQEEMNSHSLIPFGS
jgi:hypothetical protein